MLIVAPLVTQAHSWRAVWWCGGVYAFLATVLVLAFVRPSPGATGSGTSSAGAAPPPAMSTAQVLRRRDLWLLSAAFGCFNMVVLAAATYLPTFLMLFRGMSLPHAGLLVSIPFMVSIVAGPASGVLSDLVGSRKRPYLAGLVLLAAAMPLIVVLRHPGVLLILFLVQGLALGLVPTNVFSAGVEAVGDERLGGLAMAVIMVGQNAGFLLGPAIFGRLVESPGGWPVAFGSLSVMCLLGAAAGWLARVK
jgi:MFS family permease